MFARVCVHVCALRTRSLEVCQHACMSIGKFCSQWWMPSPWRHVCSHTFRASILSELAATKFSAQLAHTAGSQHHRAQCTGLHERAHVAAAAWHMSVSPRASCLKREVSSRLASRLNEPQDTVSLLSHDTCDVDISCRRKDDHDGVTMSEQSTEPSNHRHASRKKPSV